MHKFVTACTEQVDNRKIGFGDRFKRGFNKGLQSK